MDYDNIKRLLDKYWEGETSIEEEKQIRAYFNGSEVAADLKALQPMFQYFKEAQAVQIENEKFDEELFAMLGSETATEAPKRPKIAIWVTGLIVAILIGLAGYMTYERIEVEQAPEIYALDDLSEEERLAYEQTKLALSYVSEKLNGGASIAASNIARVHETTDKVFK